MIPDFWTARVEAYLAKILGQAVELPVPQTRVDRFLAKIAGESVALPAPQARVELYLAKIAGESVELPIPQTRVELYLAKKAGMDVDLPAEPQTRLEAYLAEWAGEPSGQWKTVTGSLIHITDALASPVNALSVNIDPVQSGTGDPSPDNVRPISGWTGAKVNRTGKNLLRLIESEMTSSGWDKRFPFSIKAGTYTFSCQNQFGATAEKLGVGLRFLDSDGNVVRSAWASDYNFGNTIMSGQISFTAEQAAQIVKISMTPRASGLSYQEIMDGQLMLEVGETATAYEAYSGTTIPITFPTPPGTVYGGTLDVTTGVLTVKRAIHAFTGDENIALTQTGTYGYRIGFRLDDGRPPTTAQRTDFICNIMTPNSNVTQQVEYMPGSALLYKSNAKCYMMCVVPLEYNSQTKAKNYLLANGFEVCYPLATPVTYQLTASEVSTLLGENNIWADTGDTTVTYLGGG